ncbi:MAG: histidine kinase [Actinomycetota bacterium]|nr:histidine kinase [Actinomycetota bacterium]
MTSDPSPAVRSVRPGEPGEPGEQPFPAGLGPLGRRLLAAFVAVALSAVALVTVAALVGSDRGLVSQRSVQRQDTARAVARAAALDYREAGEWAGADLSRTTAVALGTGTRLTILDARGQVVVSLSASGVQGGPRRGQQGAGQQGTGQIAATAGQATATAAVVVDSRTVGTVVLGFRHETVAGRPVAWTWVIGAGLLAVALAVRAGWVLARRLTRPVVALTRAARAHAAGDRDARAAGPGSGPAGIGELAELVEAFDAAADNVQRSERDRRRMAADVAHELRTPLAALCAGLEELRDGLAPADPPALARLHDQSLRLTRIVADLQELSSAEAAGPELVRRPTDLTALVLQEVRDREPQLRAAGLAVRVEFEGSGTGSGSGTGTGSGTGSGTGTGTGAGGTPGPARAIVDGDPHRLHQVVANLLQNCALHCRPQDQVLVRVEPAHRTGEGVHRFVISDTGPGIAPEDLPHVFERFWRGHPGTGAHGSGLGLAIVHSLVEAHGGAVRVESDGRSGTTVTVDLPASRDSEDRGHEVSERTKGLRGRKG